MIIDTSAIIAILTNEAGADELAELLSKADEPKISAGTYLETGIVVDANRDPILRSRLQTLLRIHGIEVEPVTWSQADIALQAYRDFGRASGHPAKLNFGDCFAYALARDTGLPLLFKGDDFSKTDIASARHGSA